MQLHCLRLLPCEMSAGIYALTVYWAWFRQKIKNLGSLTTLTSLYLGKNKINKIENLDKLTNLRILSLQVRDYM